VRRVSARSAARGRRRRRRRLERGKVVEQFSLRTRADNLERLASERFDVLIIGGGITGAGVALDAASRGLKVALVERRDFASGTSSKSSRLAHGGLRYLRHGEFGLVHESQVERRRLIAMAPHLVRPLQVVLPVFRTQSTRRSAATFSTALTIYDVLGGAGYRGRHRRVHDVALAPSLDRARLARLYCYWEAVVDDARLTLSVVRTAALRHGAVVANYCAATAIGKAGGKVATVACTDELDGATFEVATRSVANASGVWSDEVRRLDEAAPPAVRPARGVHVVVPRALLPGEAGALLPVPGTGRLIVTIPWGAVTLIGTTDSDHEGPLDDPEPAEDEIELLLAEASASLAVPLTRGDVVAAYAGLRPLVADASAHTADLSRRHRVTSSEAGVVTICGGKLTTWRRMAEDTVDRLGDAVLGPLPPCRTTTLTLDGASRAREVQELAREEALGTPLLDGLPYTEAEVAYAARTEMAATVEDVLARRTRASTEAPRKAEDAGERIAELLAANA
jgi:glycerol-3-phosphate dehydrogenase